MRPFSEWQNSCTVSLDLLHKDTAGMASDDGSVDHDHSVTRMIARLKGAEADAAEDIWRRFFRRLLPLAKARLKASADRSVDEEDVLVSAFDRFFRAVREERFARLHDRDDLWQILLMLVDREVAEHYRRSTAQKRGGQHSKRGADPEDVLHEIRQIAERAPEPAFIAAFNDHLARSLSRLTDDGLRSVAMLKLEGYENPEIAQRLDISLSSVERRMRTIRQAWNADFDPGGDPQ